jgi:hypothetical protein
VAAIRALGVLLCICGVASQALADSIADVAADFSPTMNPNGVWSFGWTDDLGSAFVPSTDPRVRDGADTWRGNLAADGNPAAYHNGTGSSITLGNTAQLGAGQFALHPGPGGEYAVARYTAPDAGLATLSAVFVGLDIVGTTTDVHVLLNGSSIFAAQVTGFGAASERGFASQLLLGVGDVLDFSVGFGGNGFNNDTTGLAATVSLGPIPEPGTLPLVAVGIAGLVRRRRR